MKKHAVAILIVLMLITSFSLAAMLSTSADNTKYLSVTLYGVDYYGGYDTDEEIYEHSPFLVRVEYDNGEYDEPVENAIVSFYGETKYTDNSGKVTFEGPEVDPLDESKSFKLAVSKEGFRDRTKYVKVHSAEWGLWFEVYVWNETEESWKNGKVYENTAFRIKITNYGPDNYYYKSPVENAAVTFLNETKYTNENGEVAFVAPEIHVRRKEVAVSAHAEDTEKMVYSEDLRRVPYIYVYNLPATEPGLVKHFTRADSEGYTTKFDITGEIWRVEWDYSTSSDYPYFSYHLLDEHGAIIHGISSHDDEYDSRGVVYLKGTGEDFYFQVWDANLWSWSIDVYQEVYPDEE